MKDRHVNLKQELVKITGEKHINMTTSTRNPQVQQVKLRINIRQDKRY